MSRCDVPDCARSKVVGSLVRVKMGLAISGGIDKIKFPRRYLLFL